MRKKLDDVEMTPFLRKVTLFSSGGPFLEGYVLSIIGVALIQLTPALNIDAHMAGILGIASLVGLFVGAAGGGYLTDLIGRKKMFVLDLVTIIILSILCMFVADAWQLALLRFLIGVTIGADYPIATSMIAEFTPRRYRSHSMGVIAAMWYIGANVAYLVGYFLIDIEGGWRWMLGSAVIPCIVILLGRVSIPESPRWLYSKGQIDEANNIVHQLFGEDVELEDEETVQTSWAKIFQPAYLKRVLFVGIIWLCQAIPMFAVYTFGPKIIESFGLSTSHGEALIGELVIGLFFMAGTIPAMFLAESWGRRPLIILCFAVMSGALAVLGWWPAAPMLVVVACFGIYALFSGGPGNLEWLYPNELFPTDIRASAMGVAMALSRIGTVVSIYGLPAFLETYGTGPTMLVGAGISVLGFLVSWAWAPETKGYTLAETGHPNFNARKPNMTR